MKGTIYDDGKDHLFQKRIEVFVQTRQKVGGRIRAAIKGLAYNPPVGDIKVMQGYHDGTMRLRVGAWRVIYRNKKDGAVEIILVIEIGNRGDIYK